MRPPLRVGTVYDFRNTPESGMDMPSLYAAIMDRVAMLDGLGLDLVWFTEHHFLDDGYHVQALLPKFREMAAEAGRDLASVPITIWGAKENLDLLRRDRDDGVSRVVVSFNSAKADTILPELDRWATLIRQLGS